MVIAPMFITPLEVTLVALLEPALAPVWVWAGFGELPNAFTIAGLALLLATLALYEAYNYHMLADGERGPIPTRQKLLEDEGELQSLRSGEGYAKGGIYGSSI